MLDGADGSPPALRRAAPRKGRGSRRRARRRAHRGHRDRRWLDEARARL